MCGTSKYIKPINRTSFTEDYRTTARKEKNPFSCKSSLGGEIKIASQLELVMAACGSAYLAMEASPCMSGFENEPCQPLVQNRITIRLTGSIKKQMVSR
jgi:hypothetical protein